MVLTGALNESIVHIGESLHDDIVDDLLDHAVDEDSDAATTPRIAHQLVIIPIPPARRLVVEQVILVCETAHLFLRYFSESQVALVCDQCSFAANRCVLCQLIHPCLDPFKAFGRGDIEA